MQTHRAAPTPAERVWAILRRERFATLATATLNGAPWASPLLLAYDAECRFFWVSEREARHSELITNNPRVAFSIFSPDRPEDGLYIEGEASEVPPELL